MPSNAQRSRPRNDHTSAASLAALGQSRRRDAKSKRRSNGSVRETHASSSENGEALSLELQRQAPDAIVANLAPQIGWA
jgi:hypothetical protein